MLTRRQFIIGSTALIAGAAGTGGYAWFIEPHWLEVVGVPMLVRNLPGELEGATLAHLTDIHVGENVSDAYVLDTFATVAAANPDIVVVTGDLTAYHPDVIEQAKRIYSELPHGRLATLAVLGNHDYGVGWSDVDHAAKLTAALDSLGIRVLSNEVVSVAGLQVAGMDDLWARRFDAQATLAGLDPAAAMLALSHNPDSADLEGWDGFEGWILSGHTHGGQVRPPFMAPPRLPVQNRRYTSGEFELSGNRQMYIGRGVGHLALQTRFLVRPEVTLFELGSA
ncbi:MAG: metallophosphoesterase [Actinobacteria bacterium]|nr:MAG: metallophosphoesterase [Actinomycetota bacterium]